MKKVVLAIDEKQNYFKIKYPDYGYGQWFSILTRVLSFWKKSEQHCLKTKPFQNAVLTYNSLKKKQIFH